MLGDAQAGRFDVVATVSAPREAVAAVFILIEAACDLTALILWAVETGDSSASR